MRAVSSECRGGHDLDTDPCGFDPEAVHTRFL